jgi:hypothetical protein
MEAKIGLQFYASPIRALYEQSFESGEAQAIARVVVEECLSEEGRGKEMIYE